MSWRGIDVSEWNGWIDWDTVKSQIDYAIIKLGNIGDNTKFWLDPKFERNYNECVRLGIPIGVYVYCYSNEVENARQAGREVAEYLSDKNLQLPVYIDMEDAEIEVEGKEKLSNIVKAFNTVIEQSGKWAGVYATRYWFDNLLTDEVKKLYTTWIAHVDYTYNQDKYEEQYDMFQYSWEGKINGINGNVDMNIMYRDLISQINGSSPSPVQTVTPKKSNEEIADEVIAGRWGNGQDRIDRLTAEGYDYQAIQDIVNQKLGYHNEQTYIVKAGDTLSGIASMFGTTYQELAQKNGIANPNLIFPGQVIRI